MLGSYKAKSAWNIHGGCLVYHNLKGSNPRSGKKPKPYFTYWQVCTRMTGIN